MDFFQRLAISVAFQDGESGKRYHFIQLSSKEHFYLFILFFIFEIYIREKKNTYVILRQMLILEDLFLCSTVSSLVIIDRMIVLKRW